MKREIIYENDARSKLQSGVDKIFKAVAVTLGPKGRNVIIRRSRFDYPHSTKDGVTVAKEVYLDDSIEDMAAQMVKEVAIRTVNDAGDGTSTACVLSKAIIDQGLEHMKNGGNPVMINKGIRKAVDAIINYLDTIATPISGKKELTHVATVSANHDVELGNIVGEAMYEVGEDGNVIAELSQNNKVEFEIVKGMQMSKGMLQPWFINNPKKMNCVLNNPLVLIVDETIKKINDLMPIINYCVDEYRPLLIVCNNLEGEALQTIIINKQKRIFDVCVVQSPGWGNHKRNMLQDLAIVTGTSVISEDNGILLSQVKPELLGECAKVESNKHSTVIVGGLGKSSDIKERIETVKANIEETKDKDELDQLKERLGKLNGKVGIIHVGAKTELVMKEKKDRVDDALAATSAAREEGVVSGGGVALLRSVSVLDSVETDNEDEKTGIEIIRKAIELPLKTILENAGLEMHGHKLPWWKKIFSSEKESIFNTITKNPAINFGYDAREEEFVEDMVKKGIIDPKKVTRCALQNAAEVSGLILTTECVISDENDENDEK